MRTSKTAFGGGISGSPEPNEINLLPRIPIKNEGEKLSQLIKSQNNNIEEVFIEELGSALGAHAGPGALAVGLQTLD